MTRTSQLGSSGCYCQRSSFSLEVLIRILLPLLSSQSVFKGNNSSVHHSIVHSHHTKTALPKSFPHVVVVLSCTPVFDRLRDIDRFHSQQNILIVLQDFSAVQIILKERRRFVTDRTVFHTTSSYRKWNVLKR